MRDNDNRIQVPVPGAVSTVQQGTPLQFSTPTEIVPLPSQGKFYGPGHPLHGCSEIEIKFMTAKEEDILTSKALIKKGVAIDRMLQSLIIDKNVKVEDLLVGDKNALTIAARISGYGPEYAVSVICPECEEKTKFTFDLSEMEPTEVTEPKSIGATLTESGTFMLQLIKTGVNVEFKLLTGKDESEILTEMNRTKQKEENLSTSQLKRIIVSVEGQRDRGLISNFVDNLPVVDAKLLRGVVKRLTPDVDMRQTFSCSSCGHEGDMEVPFTVEFFWPK